MFTILFRFIFVYFFLFMAMKILGKRQIGEMQMSELVAAFFLSELATFAATETRKPMYQGLVLIAVMILIEIVISVLALKFPFMKRFFDASPALLIRDGKILEKELRKNRMTLDELFSHLRLNGYYMLDSVRFAILEPNGQLSVIPYHRSEPPSFEELKIQTEEPGLTLVLIDDGVVDKKALTAIGKNEKWLKRELDKNKITKYKDVFIFTSDFAGNTNVLRKEKNQ